MRGSCVWRGCKRSRASLGPCSTVWCAYRVASFLRGCGCVGVRGAAGVAAAACAGACGCRGRHTAAFVRGLQLDGR